MRLCRRSHLDLARVPCVLTPGLRSLGLRIPRVPCVLVASPSQFLLLGPRSRPRVPGTSGLQPPAGLPSRAAWLALRTRTPEAKFTTWASRVGWCTSGPSFPRVPLRSFISCWSSAGQGARTYEGVLRTMNLLYCATVSQGYPLRGPADHRSTRH